MGSCDCMVLSSVKLNQVFIGCWWRPNLSRRMLPLTRSLTNCLIWPDVRLSILKEETTTFACLNCWLLIPAFKSLSCNWDGIKDKGLVKLSGLGIVIAVVEIPELSTTCHARKLLDGIATSSNHVECTISLSFPTYLVFTAYSCFCMGTCAEVNDIINGGWKYDALIEVLYTTS